MPFVSPESFAKQTIASIQDYSILCWRAVANLFSSPRYWADIYTQMDSIGVGSMPIVVTHRLLHRLRSRPTIGDLAPGVWLCQPHR